MNTTLDIAHVAAPLASSHVQYARLYPGDPPSRQPVHTVYGGAHLFAADTAAKLGKVALRTLDLYASDAFSFAHALALPCAQFLPTRSSGTASARSDVGDLARDANPEAFKATTIFRRVRAKLEREPVEDFRIDFEDGYGNRTDADEDGHAIAAATALAAGLRAGTAAAFNGIRIKPFSAELHQRSLRTLDLFVTTLVRELGKLPEHFVVTLPKITSTTQVEVLVQALAALEKALRLDADSLKLEFMIETPQSILDRDGRVLLPILLHAAQGRCIAAHFGTYDYTAGCSITAAHQHMRHPACDFARHMMQVAYAGTGLWLSDGATNIMPIGPHKGDALTPPKTVENTAAVHAAWRLHVTDIQHSLTHGFYQGWDLHPGQLPSRYAAVYSFFLEGLDAASQRLKNFIDKAAQATLVGDVFDDAATGQGLLNFFLRGIHCGALDESEAQRAGVTLAELRGRSFLKILENRRRRPS